MGTPNGYCKIKGSESSSPEIASASRARREEPEQYVREVCTGNIEKTYTEEPSREELVRTVVETFVLPLGTNDCSARSRTRRACSRSRSWNADRNRKTPTEEDCRQNELKTLLATYAREGYTVSTPFYT
ncbi:hypothetical protein T09_7788, partial [Trichinella sp. T9]